MRRLVTGVVAALAVWMAGSAAAQEKSRLEKLPEGFGLAAKYAGDAGIAGDKDVVFVENFETGGVDDFRKRWTNVSNKDGKVLFLADAPAPGSAGKRSLRMTATRGANNGGHLFKVFKPGYEQLFARFYVKFAPNHPYTHHFVKLQGSINPPRWPLGHAGRRGNKFWSTGIEPAAASRHQYPSTQYPPTGIWHFYTYWPEMRSWQTVEGRGKSFYGNTFAPAKPRPILRDKWTCVEMMVKMNSSPEKSDGEQVFWIDGKVAGDFRPGSVTGYWMRDAYRLSDTDRRAKPFEGFRWRKDMRLNVNKFWLCYYITDRSFKKTEKYLAKHPACKADTRAATVWIDDVVIARKYIGPVKPQKKGL